MNKYASRGNGLIIILVCAGFSNAKDCRCRARRVDNFGSKWQWPKNSVNWEI